jgi:hypothetical protein
VVSLENYAKNFLKAEIHVALLFLQNWVSRLFSS